MSLSQEEFEELRKENEALRNELDKIHGRSKAVRKRSIWFSKKVGSAFAGKWLRNSFLKLYKEIPEKNIQTETLADVTASLLWRITRIGVITLCFAILPTVILLFQTNLLIRQNRILAQQNIRLDQQTNLAEATRRGTVTLEMSNIMDQVDREISTTGTVRTATQTRLITHVQSLKPYKFLENDALTKVALSPERAQLFLYLATSRMSNETKINIFKKSRFSHADLKESYLNLVNIDEANLPYARFDDSEILGADWDGVDLSFSTFNSTHLEQNKYNDCNLRNAEIGNVGWFQNAFTNSNLNGARFENSFLYAINFKGSTLSGTSFNNTVLEECNFSSIPDMSIINWENAIVSNKDFIKELVAKKIKGATEIESNFKVGKEVDLSKILNDNPYLPRFLSMNKGKQFYRIVSK